ncbi:MAG: hypothetical protein IPK82_02790 [Polyangiaceae bacterium]|nr:hypothetical protein [Polyangiaceae bacterium]
MNRWLRTGWRVFVLGTTAFLAACDDSGGGTGGNGGGGASGGGGTGGSTSSECGGLSGKQCAANEYCDYSDNSCGAADQQGTCKPRPESCPELYSPVCTCAGTVASSDCDAYGSGSDLAQDGGCTPPEGMFGCGSGFCEVATQYCQRTGNDVGGEPDYFECKDLPAACNPGPVSCDCLAGEGCGSTCSEANGGFTLTCLGG